MSIPSLDQNRSKPNRASFAQNSMLQPQLGGQPDSGGQQRERHSQMRRIRVLRGLEWLDDIVPLPQTLRGYFLFVLALSIVCALAIFQVWTSLRITQARAELAALRLRYDLIEQKNAELLWKIGQRTTLDQVQKRAVLLDFHPALKRNYVSLAPQRNDLSRAESASPAPAASSAGPPATPPAAPSPATQDAPVHTARLEATGTASDEPSSQSGGCCQAFSVNDVKRTLAGWQQQANERRHAAWQSVHRWSEPLLERAANFFLGQLKQP